MEEQEQRAQQQDARLAKQEATIARQQRQVEALTAIVRKMSEKIELNETTPQLVAEQERCAGMSATVMPTSVNIDNLVAPSFSLGGASNGLRSLRSYQH